MRNFSRFLLAITFVLATVSWTETSTYDRQSQSEIEKRQFYDDSGNVSIEYQFYIYIENEKEAEKFVQSKHPDRPDRPPENGYGNKDQYSANDVAKTETGNVINYVFYSQFKSEMPYCVFCDVHPPGRYFLFCYPCKPGAS